MSGRVVAVVHLEVELERGLGQRKTACGHWIAPDAARLTKYPDAVTCLSCLRRGRWGASWLSAQIQAEEAG